MGYNLGMETEYNHYTYLLNIDHHTSSAKSKNIFGNVDHKGLK